MVNNSVSEIYATLAYDIRAKMLNARDQNMTLKTSVALDVRHLHFF